MLICLQEYKQLRDSSVFTIVVNTTSDTQIVGNDVKGWATWKLAVDNAFAPMIEMACASRILQKMASICTMSTVVDWHNTNLDWLDWLN